MITVEDLVVRYGRTTAVAGAGLEARPGQTVGMIGPNGSGKSTLLRAVFGALEPSAGRVLVDGEGVGATSPRDLARRVAAVAQEESPTLPLTAWETVLLGRSVHLPGWRAYREEDRAVAWSVLKTVGAENLAHRPVTELSGGERQRVVIARALAQRAGNLLLDEPTNHLDVRYQHEVMTLVRDLPLTTVVVLHDLNLAARYCDELVLLDRGTVVAAGTPGVVLRPEVLEPVYNIAVERVDHGDVVQLLFAPLTSTERPRTSQFR